MAMHLQDNTVMLEGVVYEDEIVPLRDFLQAKAPEGVVFDLSGCDDVHLGILQVILSYAKMYTADFRFPVEPKLFQKVCEGFESGELHCA